MGRPIRTMPILTMLLSHSVFVAVLSPRCIPSTTTAQLRAKKSHMPGAQVVRSLSYLSARVSFEYRRAKP